MESPNKRLKTSSPALDAQADFVPLQGDDKFGHVNEINDQYTPLRAPREPQAGQPGDHHSTHSRRSYDPRRDPRNARDRPKSKHALPGYEPWILVKTKFRRQFVHNTQTKQSLWQIPKDIVPGVVGFEAWEKDRKEKADNAKWAEDQLKQMQRESKAAAVNKAADEEGRSRRRRSESLQREDEEAFMAELAAQAERQELNDVKETVQAVQTLEERKMEAGLESDSEYEVIEVTDTEGEEDGEEEHDQDQSTYPVEQPDDRPEGHEESGPVEFGEDDIAHQLAAMGEDYGLDPGEYGEDYEEEWEEGAEGLALTEDDAASLFRDLLDDYRISPFTPWDTIIADDSDTGILNDQRYTVLPNMRRRREVFDAWARDKAAQIKEDRAAMEKRDPKIPYLAFLQEKATPKLYWIEFKRKFKKEPELNDRKMSDKDREKLYRDHINRLKLPESARKADLLTLLKSLPLKDLNRDTTLDSLPQQLPSHLHFISLPPATRDPILQQHMRSLPSAPQDGDMSAEQRADEDKRREERRRREKALAERERKVEDERRQAEKDEIRARRNLREEERELQRAMAPSNRSLAAHFREEGDAVG